MKRIVMLIFVLFWSSSVLANEDVSGWQKIKWGMTKDVIKKIYNTHTHSTKEHTEILDNFFSVGELDFEVHFIFNNKSNKIQVVHLLPQTDDSMSAFAKLSILLEQKYGYPEKKKTSLYYDYMWNKENGRVGLFHYFEDERTLLLYAPYPDELNKL